MAKILTIGLDPVSADQLASALSRGGHQIVHKSGHLLQEDLLDCDIVFACAEGKQYFPLLRKVRESCPELPFVVVTRVPETSDWLDALEAGATDYCSAPFDPRHMSWLMETAVPERRTAAAA